MASPFSLFRKYMKPLMVVLCGMAMLAFVVVDPLMQYWATNARGGAVGQDGSKVVVTWKNGQLTESELYHLVARRNLLARFQAAVFQQGLRAAYLEGAESLSMSVQPLQLPIEQSQGVEEDVVRTQVLADLARQQGMAVSDEAIKDFLDKVGRNRVTFDEMNVLLAQLSNQNPMATQIVFDAARDELLRQNFLASYSFAISTMLPERAWADWRQVNDRVIVEAAALKTSDFMDRVKEPTDEEIRKLYEQYKDVEVQPVIVDNTELPSATPGFAVPRMVRLQYLEANYDSVRQAMMEKVTDEEIAKFYEENKDLFIRADSGAAKPAPDAATPLDDAERDLFGVPKDLPPAEVQETPNSTPEPPAESPEPPAAESADPSAEKPAEEPEIPSAAPQNEQSRSHSARDAFRLTAYQEPEASEAEATATQEEAEQPAEQKPIAESPATESTPEEKPEATEKPADESSTEDTPEAEKPSVASETAAAAADKPDLKLVEYQPLEEVKEQIRRAIADQKVATEIRKQMDDLFRKLNEAYLPFFDSRLAARHDDKPEPNPPAELSNLQPLAEPNGLKFHDTGTVSIWQFRELPIAGSYEVNDSSSQPMQLVGLVSSRLRTFEPVLTRDLYGNFYLAVVTESKPGYVPTFEQARDEVVQAWKRQATAKLALQEAERLAQEIESKDLTFGDKFANDPKVEIVVTDPFSWRTQGAVMQTTQAPIYRLSDPPQIVAAGPDFMKAVFELGEGQVGAALNNDGSIAYVVRIQEHLDSPDQLQQQFLQAMASGWFDSSGVTLLRQQRVSAFRSLVQSMEQELDLDWKRLPDVSRVKQEEEL